MTERITESELAVLERLWMSAPQTATQIGSGIADERNWTMATVKTLLARLVAKGALATEQDGRRFLYRPLVAREDYSTRESRRLIDRLFGGRVSPLVAHLAEHETLSDSDIADLKDIIARLEK